jgi:2-iminoacetate synthase
MFSRDYNQHWLATGAPEPLREDEALRLAQESPPGDPALARLLFAPGFGAGGELDAILLARSEQVKAALFRRTVQAVVPVYVSSICNEDCLYCNYRAGNQGAAVRRLRLKDEELRQEAEFLIQEKGFHCLELVYASDPAMRGAAMCRHVELVRNLLERNGGGAVGLSAQALEEHEYRSLLNAGLSFSVLWQETYDRARYQQLHPGRGPKASFEYRLEAYERMLAAGLRDIGIGVLTGLSPWKRDWAMLIRHEAWLRKHCGHPAAILGIPRLKPAPGALVHSTPFLPSDQEFLATVALHNLLFPEVRPFVSTRESFEMCVQLARGGGCLFTFNCTTIPGGYTLHNPGYQFPSGSYDAPVYSRKLAEAGLATDWNWAWYEEKLYGHSLVGAS